MQRVSQFSWKGQFCSSCPFFHFGTYCWSLDLDMVAITCKVVRIVSALALVLTSASAIAGSVDITGVATTKHQSTHVLFEPDDEEDSQARLRLRDDIATMLQLRGIGANDIDVGNGRGPMHLTEQEEEERRNKMGGQRSDRKQPPRFPGSPVVSRPGSLSSTDMKRVKRLHSSRLHSPQQSSSFIRSQVSRVGGWRAWLQVATIIFLMIGLSCIVAGLAGTTVNCTGRCVHRLLFTPSEVQKPIKPMLRNPIVIKVQPLPLSPPVSPPRSPTLVALESPRRFIRRSSPIEMTQEDFSLWQLEK